MYSVRLLKSNGNIKVGELYFSKWRYQYKFYHYSTCAKIENGKIYPTEGAGAEKGFPLEDGVKMGHFLCSDDIQAGDEIRHSTTPEIIGKYLREFGITDDYIYAHFEHEDGPACTVKKSCFRVVAEISPEATWVSPSDRFDEDEVKFVLIEGDMREQEMSPQTLMSFVGRSYKNVRAYIKGPCGHFH